MPYLGQVGRVTKGVSDSYEWTLPGFLTLKGNPGDWYESPYFHVFDEAFWKLVVYPRCYVTSFFSPNFVSISLCRGCNNPLLPLHLTLGIRGEKGVWNLKERTMNFSNGDPRCAWDGFVDRSQLGEGDLVLILCMKKRAVDSSTQTTSSEVEEEKTSEKQGGDIQQRSELSKEDNGAILKIQEGDTSQRSELSDKGAILKVQGLEELQASFRGLLAEEEDSDVTLKVRDKEFRAHRAILRARTPVFRAMFAHDMVEKQSGRVTMEDCDPESFPEFLEHVYGGGVEMITSGNVISLFIASDKYDLKTLRRACLDFLMKNISVDSFCDAIATAIRYQEDELLELSTNFFCDHTLDIIQTVEWQNFLVENPTVSNELYIKKFKKQNHSNK